MLEKLFPISSKYAQPVLQVPVS